MAFLKEIEELHRAAICSCLHGHNSTCDLHQEEEKAAAEAVVAAAQEYSHAATRHLYFQRAQLQLSLRQLHFCSTELTGNLCFRTNLLEAFFFSKKDLHYVCLSWCQAPLLTCFLQEAKCLHVNDRLFILS